MPKRQRRRVKVDAKAKAEASKKDAKAKAEANKKALYSFGAGGRRRRMVKCGSSSVGRATAFQAVGRGFEPRLPLRELEIF